VPALLDGDRAAFPFRNPNHLAALLAFGAAVAVLETRRASGRVRWAALGLAAVLGLTVLATGSRGGVLALAVGIGAAALLGRKRALLAVAGVVVFAAAALAGVYAVRFASSPDPFAHERVRIWRVVAETWSEQPLTGIGPGNLAHLYHQHNFPSPVSFARYGRSVRNADSTYLQILAEQGLLGAVALAVLRVVLLLRAARPREGIPRHAGAAPYAALLVAGLFTDLASAPVLVWAPLVLYGSTAVCRVDRRSAPPRRIRVAGLLCGLALVGLAAWAAVLAPYLSHRCESRAAESGDHTFRYPLLLRATTRNPIAPGPPRALGRRWMGDVRISLLAWSQFATAAHLAPLDPRPRTGLGRLFFRLHQEAGEEEGAARRAISRYREAVRLDPYNPFLRVEAAGVLGTLGEEEEAVGYLEEAVELEPYFLRGRVELVRARLRRGEMDAVRRELSELQCRREQAEGLTPGIPYEDELLRLDPEDVAALEAGLAELQGEEP
jgi:O-antigen ligase